MRQYLWLCALTEAALRGEINRVAPQLAGQEGYAVANVSQVNAYRINLSMPWLTILVLSAWMPSKVEPRRSLEPP